MAAFPAGRSSGDRSAARAGTASESAAGSPAGSDSAGRSPRGSAVELECEALAAGRAGDGSSGSSGRGTCLHRASVVAAASEASACRAAAESACLPVRDVPAAAAASAPASKSAESCDGPAEVPGSPARADRASDSRDVAAVVAASGSSHPGLGPVAASAGPFDLSARCDADEGDTRVDIAAAAVLVWDNPARIAASRGWAGNLHSETAAATFRRPLPPSRERGAWACNLSSVSVDCSIGGCSI